MGDRTMEFERTSPFLESDTGSNLMGFKQQQAPISQLQTTSTMPFLTENIVQQKAPIVESLPMATESSPIISSSLPAATTLQSSTATSLPAATALPTGSTGYVKVSEQHFNDNATVLQGTQLAGSSGFISSSAYAAPAGTSYTSYPYSSNMYTSEIVHGQYIKQDRYGNASVLRVRPRAILNQGLVHDVPCYIVSAEEDKKYLELPFKKSELALDQQVILTKKNLFHGRMQRWIIRPDGFIEHETNRNMVLGVHKPADLINPTQVSELLVTAQNRRLIGENATGVKWTFVPAPYYGISRSSEEGQFFFIALAADPSWVLDVARLASTKDIKSGFRVVLRKNAGFTDDRQKWILKPFYPSF